MDTVEGVKGTDAPILLVLSERASCLEIIKLMAGKTHYDVKNAIDQIELEVGTETFINTFRSITTDRCSEFLDYMKI